MSQEEMHYQMLQQMTPEQQQQYIMQMQNNQYAHQDQYESDNNSYQYEPNQQVQLANSYRSGNEFNNTPGSRASAQTHYNQTPNSHNVVSNQQREEDNYHYSQTPSIYTSKNGRDDNFKVIIRVRPPLPREQDSLVPFRSCLHISPDNKSVSLMEYMGAEVNERERQMDIEENPQLCVWHNFTYDFVYDPGSTQNFLYDNTAKPAVLSVLEGYNATMLAYGQTGTGKTYTMEGFKYSGCDPQRGIVPRSMEQIFKYIEASSNKNSTFMVRASYLQIYNEVISDLLKTDRTSLSIREDKKKGIFVEGLSEWAVRSPNEIYSLMQKGAMSRKTAWTNKNDVSSRSHAVFIIIVEQMKTLDNDKQIKVGKLNLVDLAGSESVRITGATGERLEESKKINQSLSCLGNVIAALTDVKPRTHIPYRDSKLTRLLKDSLGGNCKTTMMMMVSPAPEAFSETASTLKFGMRAKRIKNDARINEDVDQRALLRKYEVELRKLKQELESKSHVNGDPQAVTQLEEEKRRAEEDKEAAINALEVRSREYMIEREEKMRLEEKIRLMNSQVLTGGKKMEETPQFRVALEKKHKQIREFYDEKLKEIEQERNQIEEEKTQVDRYKQLLIKQRDIMIALTNRLNERDETIIQLQEELDAYDKIHRETEVSMENKNERIHLLEDFIKDNDLEIPGGETNEDDYEVSDKLGKRYPPYQTDQIGDFEVPMKLLTPEEKIQELSQVIEEQKMHMETLEQERAELIDSKADFMSEKINEIVNREVNKELERIQSQTENQEFEEDHGEGEESEEYEHHIQNSHPEQRAMMKMSNSNHNQYEEDEEDNYSEHSQNNHRNMNSGYDMNNGRNINEAGKENQYASGHYPEDYESVASYKNSQADSQSSSYRQSQKPSMITDKVYERRLPPNVEEMLKQKRLQMANQLAQY